MEDTKVNILVDFNILFNEPLGILDIIKRDLNNPKFVKSEYFNNSDGKILYDICDMDNNYESVYKLIFKEGIDTSLIKNEFLYGGSYYEELINTCPYTNVLKLMNTFNTKEMAKVTVLCKNKYQEQKIKPLSFDTIAIKDVINDRAMITKYDALYFDFYGDVLLLGDFTGKTIYLSNCRYNKEKEMKDIPNLALNKYFVYNAIGFINIF